MCCGASKPGQTQHLKSAPPRRLGGWKKDINSMKLESFSGKEIYCFLSNAPRSVGLEKHQGHRTKRQLLEGTECWAFFSCTQQKGLAKSLARLSSPDMPTLAGHLAWPFPVSQGGGNKFSCRSCLLVCLMGLCDHSPHGPF